MTSRTVQNRLLEAGRKAKKPLKKQILTHEVNTERLEWGKNRNIGL